MQVSFIAQLLKLKKMTEKILTYEDLDININDVYEQMGYQDETPDSSVVFEVSVMIEEVRKWLSMHLRLNLWQNR